MKGPISNEFLPFSLPDIGEEEINEVVDSIRSGWLTTGPKTKQFETDFAKHIGAGVEAIAVNSATAGLHLALEAAGVTAGDEVITSVYTFTATAEVVRYLGAEPVFVDICHETLNLDPSLVEAAITPKTKAIIPVHVAGLACEMDQIVRIAAAHGLKVIEDAAHALPATFRGQLVGGLETDATVFSFYATKPLATGEGGMVVTRDRAIADRCRVMRLHGIDRDAFDRYRTRAPSWYYEVVAPGFKYNMTDLAAAIGIHQLRKIDRHQRVRADIAEKYRNALRNLPLQLPAEPHDRDLHTWHLFIIRLAEGATVDRDTVIAEMAERRIGTSVHFIPLHLHPYWGQRYRLAPNAFPVALRAYETAISLPIYTRMSVEQQDTVIDSVKDILNS